MPDGSVASFGPIEGINFNQISNLPTTLQGHNITLQLSDIPNGIDYQTLQNRPDVSALDEILDFPDLASFPVTGEAQKLYIDTSTGYFYRWTTPGYVQLTGLAASWGNINGTLANQTDLKALTDSLQAQITALTAQVENQKYKVGDIYATTDPTNPATRLGYGTWEAYAAGRVLVGHDSGDSDFATVNAVGGEKEHVLTIAEMPEHGHRAAQMESLAGGSSIGASGQSATVQYGTTYTAAPTEPQGENEPHNNLPPYIVVHLWRRTA
jgi:hypothetical protein